MDEPTRRCVEPGCLRTARLDARRCYECHKRLILGILDGQRRPPAPLAESELRILDGNR